LGGRRNGEGKYRANSAKKGLLKMDECGILITIPESILPTIFHSCHMKNALHKIFIEKVLRLMAYESIGSCKFI
jgi:hypothetical protein